MGKVLVIKGADFSTVAVEHIQIADWEEVDLSSFQRYSSSIQRSSNTWIGGKCIFIPVTSGSVYGIQANSNNKASYAFLTSTTIEGGSTPDYISGESSIHVLDIGTTEQFTILSNCYLYIGLDTPQTSDEALKPTLYKDEPNI